MKVHAAMRPRDDVDAEPHLWTVEADTYEDARLEINRTVMDGWVLLYVRPER